ncbi:hypothetical protein GCM10007047_03280 [Cerasicoccus arenae]|uniref:Uncharacterized protein n=2 Tax=Cerasicoccus arenae TaxID=424488 RepID=A0A8J3GCS8_9BACT|nr:hypothetical protein [Cerasicoccus arenae]GHB91750.1 hypothetical protein GCM10007047_03280 [Cerasicoccus arenae]
MHTSEYADGARVEHYFGYTSVSYPATESNDDRLEVKDVENFGIALTDGIQFGYSKQKTVLLPSDNAFYVENLSDQQIDIFASIIRETETKNTLWLLEKETNQ